MKKDVSNILESGGRGAVMAAVNGAVQVAGLPALDDAADLIAHPPARTPEVICGVLRQGWKAVLAAGSKSYKTWSLAELALDVATGSPWWGFETVRGRVLYIQLENQRAGFADRLRVIAEARGLTVPKDSLRVWNLRGHTAKPEKLIASVIGEAKDGAYSLIVFDPLYKLLAGLDENAAGQMAQGLAPFDTIAEETGAAVAYGHHFSKGSQASKESIDRMSGSGVFARDADTILTMTRHATDDAFTVEPILRECPPVEPFVLRWQYPLMERDGSLNPEDLKQPKTGRTPSHTEDDILDVLKEAGSLTTGDWQKECEEETGVSRAVFFRLRAKLKAGRKIIKSKVEDDAWMPA